MAYCACSSFFFFLFIVSCWCWLMSKYIWHFLSSCQEFVYLKEQIMKKQNNEKQKNGGNLIRKSTRSNERKTETGNLERCSNPNIILIVCVGFIWIYIGIFVYLIGLNLFCHTIRVYFMFFILISCVFSAIALISFALPNKS